MTTVVDIARLDHRREEARRLKEAALVRRASSASAGGGSVPSAPPAAGRTSSPPRGPGTAPSHAQADPANAAALEAKRMRRVLCGRPAAGRTGTDSPAGSRRPSEAGSEASTTSASSEAGCFARPASFSSGAATDSEKKAAALLKQQARMMRSMNAKNGPPPSTLDKTAPASDDFSRRMNLRAQMRGVPNGGSYPSSPAGSPQVAKTAGTPPRPSGGIPVRGSFSGPSAAPVAQRRPPAVAPPSAAMRRHMASKAGTTPAAKPVRPPPNPTAARPGPRSPPSPVQKASRMNSAGSVRAGANQQPPAKPKPAAIPQAPRPRAAPAASQAAEAEPMQCSPWNAGEDIHALRAARKKLSKEGFMEYIYTNFPPKAASRTLNTKLEVKKQMQKALSHYHPDKQNVSEHGPQWLLVCEEVCKEITRMYNKRSGPP